MAGRFPRTARIRRRGEFTGVFEQGAKRHGRLMTVVALAAPAGASRLGIAASRKLGGAVERNLAKRRLREVFRQAALPAAADIVVIPRRELLGAAFEHVSREFVSLIDGALRHVRRSPAPVAPPRGARRASSV